MVDKLAWISWRELGPQSIFNQKSILASLEERAFRQPARRVHLKRICVLSGLQVLSSWELDHNLLDADYLFDLPVVLLDRDDRRVGHQMASLHTPHLQEKILAVEGLHDFNVNRA